MAVNEDAATEAGDDDDNVAGAGAGGDGDGHVNGGQSAVHDHPARRRAVDTSDLRSCVTVQSKLKAFKGPSG